METRLQVRVRLAWDRSTVWAAMLDDPGRWLPLPAHAIDDGAWSTTLGLGPVRHAAVVRLGDPSWEGDRCVRPLAWEPVRGDATDHARGLPDFAGTVATPRTAEGLFLEVAGAYVPPGGAVGARLDAAALHRVAEGTLRRFANDVTSRLQAVVTAR